MDSLINNEVIHFQVALCSFNTGKYLEERKECFVEKIRFLINLSWIGKTLKQLRP